MLRATLTGLGTMMCLAGCGPGVAPGSPPPTPDRVLRDFGYSVHVPPSRLHGPGSLVFVKNVPGLAAGQVALGDICSPDFMAFPATVRQSDAERIGFGQGKDFQFDASGLQALGLGASASFLDRLTLQFDNTEVIEYSLEDLGNIQDALGPKCQKLLADQVAVGNAYQVLGAFKADLTYGVEFRADASAEARLAVLRELQGRFGFEFAGSQNQAGQGLYYGLFLHEVGSGAVAGPQAPAG